MPTTLERLFTDETAQAGNAKFERIAAAVETLAAKDSFLQYHGAGLFNANFRGKNLGTTSAENLAEISAKIADGSFEGLFCGDTLTGAVSGRLYDLADADYRLHCGYQGSGLTTHHIMVIPRLSMGTSKMNDTDITTGGYAGSKMYTDYLQPFIDIILSDFGASHVLSHRNIFSNAVTDGKPTGYVWATRQVDLMTEAMVYGGIHYGSGASDGTNTYMRYSIDCKQVNLFRHRPDLISPARYWFWLRDVVSAARFAATNSAGSATDTRASLSGGGVRPAFLLY